MSKSLEKTSPGEYDVMFDRRQGRTGVWSETVKCVQRKAEPPNANNQKNNSAASVTGIVFFALCCGRFSGAKESNGHGDERHNKATGVANYVPSVGNSGLNILLNRLQKYMRRT
jgi:hypothetical protein